ncbi:MAG: hypothetical protein VKJ06_01175 [Vampirovibrionales bacterium]|nr:hypothetical protein [Vampirovibrionales bacterium]
MGASIASPRAGYDAWEKSWQNFCKNKQANQKVRAPEPRKPYQPPKLKQKGSIIFEQPWFKQSVNVQATVPDRLGALWRTKAKRFLAVFTRASSLGIASWMAVHVSAAPAQALAAKLPDNFSSGGSNLISNSFVPHQGAISSSRLPNPASLLLSTIGYLKQNHLHKQLKMQPK